MITLYYFHKLDLKLPPHIHGIILIELIMTMVIISVIFASLIMGFKIIVNSCAQNQIELATEIATNYLHEISSKNIPKTATCPTYYQDPQNCIENKISSADCNLLPPHRVNYQEICHYNNLIDQGAKNIYGQALSGMEKFTITINVTPDQHGYMVGDNLDLTANLWRIDVTVNHKHMPNIILSTYKGAR